MAWSRVALDKREGSVKGKLLLGGVFAPHVSPERSRTKTLEISRPTQAPLGWARYEAENPGDKPADRRDVRSRKAGHLSGAVPKSAQKANTQEKTPLSRPRFCQA